MLSLFEGLSRPYSSILIQIRSICIGLQHFLYKMNIADSDECHCGEGSQTPRHILLQCSSYVDLRRTILDKVKLSDFSRHLNDYNALMAHPHAVRYIAEFMLGTGLLGQFRQHEIEPEDNTEQTTPE